METLRENTIQLAVTSLLLRSCCAIFYVLPSINVIYYCATLIYGKCNLLAFAAEHKVRLLHFSSVPPPLPSVPDLTQFLPHFTHCFFFFFL